GFVPLLLGLVLLGVLSGITAPASLALIGDSTEPEDSAMAMGLFNFAGNIGVTIGPLVFGYFVLIADIFMAFMVAGLIEVVALSFIVILIKMKFKESLRPVVEK
ncbi:MAG: MFS transporter, partial [Candidatus Thorarchaeota archaeon]